jgi:hypothetical protein
MIRKAESFNNKSLHMLVLAVALVAVVFAAVVQEQQQVYAQSAYQHSPLRSIRE